MKNATSRMACFFLAVVAMSAVDVAPAVQCAPDDPQVVISHAGSLTSSFVPVEALFTKRTGICVVDVSGGSVKLARELQKNRGRVDIFASADVEVNDRMLKPAGLVTHAIRFAEGEMVLAYTTSSKQGSTIAAEATAGVVPEAAPDWHVQLTQPGVTIGGSHPFLDPGGYRADMVFQLAQLQSHAPQLYNELLSHYVISKPGDALGKSFDYQFTYEHTARGAAAADTSGTYRYVKLPDAVSMGTRRRPYSIASVTIPGIHGPLSTPLRIPATRVTWGLSIVEGAPNQEAAERFLQLFFSPEGLALRSAGPTPINPPRATRSDITHLPPSLRSLMHPISSNLKPIQ